MRFFNLTLALILSLSAYADVWASCVRLSWTASGDDGYAGTAKTYEVRYSSVPITEDNWQQATASRRTVTPKPAGQKESLVIDGLEGGQTYYFAIKVADEKPNWSSLSNVVARVVAPDECVGSVGNANCSTDGTVSLGDVSSAIGYVFLDDIMCCWREADIDFSGEVTLGDVSRLIDHLFLSQSTLPGCR